VASVASVVESLINATCSVLPWAIVLLAIAAPTLAQSPNTGALVVTVVDQSGAVVPGAAVSAVNAANGSTRQAVSGRDGSVTLTGLQLTGAYRVSVAKAGFTTEELPAVALAAKPPACG
jgi:hypothetical protein